MQLLRNLSDNLRKLDQRMPVLFAGHGSPMNGIEDNQYSAQWELLGKTLPEPTAVLVISAHWYTRGTFVSGVEFPETMYDFHGFPEQLYQVRYAAPGSPELAKETAALVKSTTVGVDHEWGLDHGAWSVVRRMYPSATIPVLQLSIDFTKGPGFHYQLAAELAELRNKGVLILGSGNLVHNLRLLDWRNPDSGYDWAVEMNERFKELLLKSDHKSLIDYTTLGAAARLSVPTPEHYLPMLYILGLKQNDETIILFNDKTVMGSVSMTSFYTS